jgi:hypothetical protein
MTILNFMLKFKKQQQHGDIVFCMKFVFCLLMLIMCTSIEIIKDSEENINMSLYTNEHQTVMVVHKS